MKLVSDYPDNVTPLFRNRDDEKGPDRRRFCPHGGTMLIDEDTRLVQCGLCDTWLDAFTALRVLTREWERHVRATKYAKLAMQSVQKELETLKREERNTKARLRRARKLLASITEENDV